MKEWHFYLLFGLCILFVGFVEEIPGTEGQDPCKQSIGAFIECILDEEQQ